MGALVKIMLAFGTLLVLGRISRNLPSHPANMVSASLHNVNSISTLADFPASGQEDDVINGEPEGQLFGGGLLGFEPVSLGGLQTVGSIVVGGGEQPIRRMPVDADLPRNPKPLPIDTGGGGTGVGANVTPKTEPGGGGGPAPITA